MAGVKLRLVDLVDAIEQKPDAKVDQRPRFYAVEKVVVRLPPPEAVKPKTLAVAREAAGLVVVVPAPYTKTAVDQVREGDVVYVLQSTLDRSRQEQFSLPGVEGNLARVSTSEILAFRRAGEAQA